MPWRAKPREIRLVKSLRFRLALSYAIFCAIILSSLGFVLRGVLTNVIESTVERLLDEEWAALKGFIQIDKKGALRWTHDPSDREETAIVQRLRFLYMVANRTGEVIESSDNFRDLGFESPATIVSALDSGQVRFVIRTNAQGNPFMVREGALREGAYVFFVALGRDFAPSRGVINQFTWIYFSSLPVFVLCAAALGWFLARRAMQPVSDVAALAERISGHNLNVKLPLRHSDDELDHLIGSFNRMVERLEKSFTQIAQFSTDVSHELRTPVTIVRGQLEVALMTATSEQELRAAVEGALSDIERLSSIIRALLQLAKAESGQILLQLQPADLVPLARQVFEEMEIAAADKNVRLSGDFTPPPSPASTTSKSNAFSLTSSITPSSTPPPAATSRFASSPPPKPAKSSSKSPTMASASRPNICPISSIASIGSPPPPALPKRVSASA